MKIKALFAAFVATALSACQPAAETAPEISDPWARATVEGQMMAAAYVTITNPGSETLRVTKVETPVATSASFHRSMVENGVATMKALEGGIVVDGGETAVLEPGGNHIMIEGLKAPLEAGSSVPVTFTFEDGTTEGFDLVVVGAGER